LLINLIAKLWNGLGTPVRWAVLWLAHPKFIHGVAGIILDKEGRVLLLKHRFWKGQRWGLPGGLAHRGETPAATLRRELREETGLEVRPTKLLRVRMHGLLTQFVLLAECDGEPAVKSVEIIEARFWDRADIPDEMLAVHRHLLEEFLAKGEWQGLPLE
jgi:8-oxo-dGTP pyrophosphatase MutT (NUDIX family)